MTTLQSWQINHAKQTYRVEYHPTADQTLWTKIKRWPHGHVETIFVPARNVPHDVRFGGVNAIEELCSQS